MRPKIAGVKVSIATYIAQFGPNDVVKLDPYTLQPNREIQIYEGGPAARLYLGGSPGSISLVGIQDMQALLFIECRGFTIAEQYSPSREASVIASTLPVPLGGYRNIIMNWDKKAWWYRLSCTKL